MTEVRAQRQPLVNAARFDAPESKTDTVRSKLTFAEQVEKRRRLGVQRRQQVVAIMISQSDSDEEVEFSAALKSSVLGPGAGMADLYRKE